MTSDLRQKTVLSSHPPPPAAACGSNGSFENSTISLNSSGCFSSPAASAVSPYPWGTWEDLLLASAVLKHGTENWSTVSRELQARAFLVPPSLFSAEACKVRFWILNGRFSRCSNGSIRDGKIPWFEEVRKLRVAQLKRELECYDGSIGLLQRKLSQLKAEYVGLGDVAIRDAGEQDSQISLAPAKTSNCLQVCPADDRMRAQSSLGSSSGNQLEPESLQISCTTASSVTKGCEEVQGTTLVSDSKELKLENAVQLLSSEEAKGPPITELDDKPHEPQLYPCSIRGDSKSFEKVEAAEHESNGRDGAASCSMDLDTDNLECLATVNGSQLGYASELGGANKVHESRIGMLENCGLASGDTCLPCSPSGLGRLVSDNVACTVGELRCEVECTGPSCSSPELKGSVNGDASYTRSIKCQNAPSSSIEDSLLSASAIDLLRIAYADGTPVSTPEVETQPIELERPEELEGSHKADSLCPPLRSKLTSCEPGLSCCNAVEVPCQGNDEELQTTEREQALGMETALTEAGQLTELVTCKAELLNSGLAPESEHLSELTRFQVADARNLATSEVPQSLNLGVETTVGKVNAGRLWDKGTYKVEFDCKSLMNGKRDRTSLLTPEEVSVANEVHDLRKGAGSDSLELSETYGSECSASATESCSKMDKVKVEERGGVTFADDSNAGVRSDAMCECVNIAITQSVSHVDTQSGHPANNSSKLQESDQLCTPELWSMVEQKRKPCSSSKNEVMEVVQSTSRGCDPKLVHGSGHNDDNQILACHSDDTNFVVGALCELVDRQQETNPDCAVPDRHLHSGKVAFTASSITLERMIPGANADSETINKKAKPKGRIISGVNADSKIISRRAELEGSSEQVMGRTSSVDKGLPSPRFKEKCKTDIDALEEDGLLVDLMKLKDADLTTLRKRKHLLKGANNAEKCKDGSLLKDGLGDYLAKKCPKLSKQGRNEISITTNQGKGPGKQRNLKSKFCNSYNSEDGQNQALSSRDVSLLNTQPSAVEVFSSRRSLLKSRKLESAGAELNQTKWHKGGSVQMREAAVLDEADKEASELETSGVLPLVSNLEMVMENGLLPDLIVLLECLRSISSHKFAPLFKLRPEIQNDPRYRGLIRRHMDLNIVRTKLEEGAYSGHLEFFRDMMLIFSNALVFYSRDSQEYGAACILRENLIKEMEELIREESPCRSLDVPPAVKHSESKVLKDSNSSSSVSRCDGKSLASGKFSSNATVCENGFHDEDGVSEVILGSRIIAQDYELGKDIYSKDFDLEKKGREDLASNKSLSKIKAARSKAPGVDIDRLNIEGFGRERHLTLEDGNTNSSSKRESVTSSQMLRRSHQASLRTFRECTPRKESSYTSRCLKYGSDSSGLLFEERQGEPRKSSVGGRSSRNAQRLKGTNPREIQSYSQPQKRART